MYPKENILTFTSSNCVGMADQQKGIAWVGVKVKRQFEWKNYF